MYRKTTRNIEVTAEPEYRPGDSNPARGQFFWAYTIEIFNNGSESVQIKSRYWHITDGNGKVQEVSGPGVVGKEPVIPPGKSFKYTSACPLTTSTGFMVGSYQALTEGGESLTIDVPAFALISPHVNRVLN
jgi:ApaG protein